MRTGARRYPKRYPKYDFCSPGLMSPQIIHTDAPGRRACRPRRAQPVAACGRTGYVPAETARGLDTSMSLPLVAHHLVCKACGSKGAALQVRFSISDYYDQARGHGCLIPGGHSKTPPA